MPQRLGLRAWLEQQIDSGNYKGVEWLDRAKGQFIVPWKHASRHGWHSEDAALFKAWAVYTRRFQEDRGDNPSPKTWKANFRCAVNALPDIKPVKGQHNKKGKNACRVFEFSKKRKSREHVCQRQVPVKIDDVKTEKMDKIPTKSQLDENQTKYNTRRKTNIKKEHGEENSCMMKQQPQSRNEMNFERLTIKQECDALLKEPKIEKGDHCYQSKFEPQNFRPCFKDIINMNSISLLPQGREISQGNWFQNHIEANYPYSNYKPHHQYSSYYHEMTSGIPEPVNHSDLPDLKTVLEVAQCMFNDTSSGSDYHIEDLQGSDGEEFMESCRPGSVGSAALSDAELEEILMPKEEVIEADYLDDFEGENNYDYISTYCDPFLSEKEPRNDILQIKAITQALIDSSEFQ